MFILFFTQKKNSTVEEIIYEPFIPINNEEHNIKNYTKSKFNLNHTRYYFQEEYNRRKLFRINYSYFPYIKILQNNLSYEENAKYIYNSTGMLNITKLDYYYFKNKTTINSFNLNQIHLSMALDKNYCDLSLISIASILNTSSYDTYIHFHILGLNFGFKEIKKIIELKKINNKVDFIFYNAQQVEYDFEIGSYEPRGFGAFAKILSPQIINNTNKILILDSGDILCQKDLSEIFFYDIGDNYFGWILENCAGNDLKYSGLNKFMTNKFYPNSGVFLVNIGLFRRDELYKKAVFVAKSYFNLLCADQDILITIAEYKFKYIPFNYNIHLYYQTEQDKVKKNNISPIENWLNEQQYSPYKYTLDEILDAISDPVIQHFYKGKIEEKDVCDKYVIQWLKYAKLTGQYINLKLKYPKPFRCE